MPSRTPGFVRRSHPTLIFSTGRLDTSALSLKMVAYISVSPPALPKNISRIRRRWEKRPRDGVIPSVSPTVPTADAVSNRHYCRGSFSTRLITIPQTTVRKK